MTKIYNLLIIDYIINPMNLNKQEITKMINDFLKDIIIFLNKKNIKVNVKNQKIDILISDCRALSRQPEIARIIYRLLNKYEHLYFIKIRNTPYCYLPEADSHIIYKKINNYRYAQGSPCRGCKFLSSCPGLALKNGCHCLSADDIRSLRPLPDLPDEIVIEVNKNCNLSCRLCLAGEKENKIIEPDAKTIKNIIDEADSLGIANIRFTGGEPLLRTDIIDLMKYAKDKHKYVLLNTNATILTDSKIRALEECTDNALISLQGYSRSTENMLTGGGRFFEQKLGNIAKLRKSKIATIRIGTVISNLLIRNIKNYSEIIKCLGVDSWELYRPMLSCISMDKYKGYCLRPAQIKKVIDTIYKLKKNGINANIANAVPFCIVNNDKKYTCLLGARFDDGHSRIIYDARGFFKPSYFINEKLGENIEESWNNKLIKRLNSFLRLPKPCLGCEDLKWCFGGSRYYAKEYFGTYFAQDPWMKKR